MDWLSKVYSRHNEWIGIVNSFGFCPSAEDIVQDMYLELTKEIPIRSSEDKRVNPAYIGSSSEERAIGDDGTINVTYVWIMLRKCYARNFKDSKSNLTTNIGEGFEFIDKLVESDKRTEAKSIYEENIEKEIASWHHYDSLMFRIYKEDGMSLRKLANETTIPLASVVNTIANCKRRLRENCREDYIDLCNGDYELIRLR